jgi:TfoX/Sxy family transcriptional regulator of competence genes
MEQRRLAKPPAELVAFFESVLPDDPRVERKQMFGMPAAFAGGNLFAGLFESSMMLRLPADKRAEFLALPGASEFSPMPGRPMKEYVGVPEAMIGDREKLDRWVEASFAYAAGMAVKEKKARKPSRKK